MIEADFAIMNKTRIGQDQVAMTEVTGSVRDKVCIVGDDVTTTGGTLIAGARALREQGAREVWIYVTHALLTEEGLAQLGAAEDIAGIVVTDTVPIDARERPENLTVLTVSGLLAETIMNVFADDSVSAIFGGENQLF
jgi:ribose-phosphate pyrophosphokinase